MRKEDLSYTYRLHVRFERSKFMGHEWALNDRGITSKSEWENERAGVYLYRRTATCKKCKSSIGTHLFLKCLEMDTSYVSDISYLEEYLSGPLPMIDLNVTCEGIQRLGEIRAVMET